MGFTVFKQFSRTNLRKYSFSNRVTDYWNKLENDIKRASSVNMFKFFIDKHEIMSERMYDFDD